MKISIKDAIIVASFPLFVGVLGWIAACNNHFDIFTAAATLVLTWWFTFDMYMILRK